MSKFQYNLLRLNTDLERLFFKKEYQALAGDGQRTIFTLVLILFITFIALGFAVGSMQNLRTKMDNPFTNWVNLPVHSSYSDKIPEILERYESPELAEVFQLDSIRGYNRYYLPFYHQQFIPAIHEEDTLLFNLSGRTIESGEPLLETILSLNSGNLIWSESMNDSEWLPLEDDCEIIITLDMQQRLGYKKFAPEDIGYLLINNDPHFIFLKVAAVVKELPNLSSFACSSKLYNVLTGKKIGIDRCYDLVALNKETDNVFRLFSGASIDPGRVENLAAQYFQFESRPSCSLERQVKAGDKVYSICRLAFLLTEKPTLSKVRSFLASIKKEQPLAELAEIECGTPKCYSLGLDNYHYLAFNFKRLLNVRAFRDDLAENFKIEIDMSQVAAKENFALVSKLTLIISLALLAFSILGVVMFVNNLLRTHLFEVRSNLGTFQAFGLDDHFLHRIYLKIILSFLTLAIVVALALAIVIDRAEQLFFQNESQFNIFDSSILLALAGFLLISMFISIRTIRQILGDTPGNLIYKR